MSGSIGVIETNLIPRCMNTLTRAHHLQLEAERSKEHTFEPTIVSSKRKSGTPPIQDRIGATTCMHAYTRWPIDAGVTCRSLFFALM